VNWATRRCLASGPQGRDRDQRRAGRPDRERRLRLVHRPLRAGGANEEMARTMKHQPVLLLDHLRTACSASKTRTRRLCELYGASFATGILPRQVWNGIFGAGPARRAGPTPQRQAQAGPLAEGLALPTRRASSIPGRLIRSRGGRKNAFGVPCGDQAIIYRRIPTWVNLPGVTV